MAAAAAIADVDMLDADAVGKDGSKNPCECCRGRCVKTPPCGFPLLDAERFMPSLGFLLPSSMDVLSAGREKFVRLF